MPSPGGQFLSDQYGDIEDYFVTDYLLIDQYVGDTLWNWGRNSYGQLGINNTADKPTPVTTILGGTNWKVINFGDWQASGIKTDGSLWIWGYNTAGQLGINAPGNRTTPVTTILGGNNWKQVSGGNLHTAAIKTDGTLWLWGTNSSGQLGTNDNITRSIPVTTILGGNNWRKVLCGSSTSTAAVKTDGTLWVWGNNNNGQLGINNLVSISTPVTTILGGNNWKEAHISLYASVATKDDGTLWVCGDNTFGELGTNSTIIRSIPVTTILGGTNWKQAFCGTYHMAAIKTDGSLWCWGRNNYGELGINDSNTRSIPTTTILGGNNWKQVSCGYGFFSAVKTDGTLWSCGFNQYGGIGVNDTVIRSVPVTTILGGNNWKQVSCNGNSQIAVKSGINIDLT